MLEEKSSWELNTVRNVGFVALALLLPGTGRATDGVIEILGLRDMLAENDMDAVRLGEVDELKVIEDVSDPVDE